MSTKLPYLTKSPVTGTYSYRRRIPERLRPLFQGHLEYKVALKTKDISEAVGRWRVANADFKATLKVDADQSNSRSDDIVQSAGALLKTRGIHPNQAPSITAKSATEQSSQFDRWVDNFKMKEDEFVQEIADEQLDYAQRQRDYDQGIWGSPDYQEPYKPMDPRSPKAVALRIMRGELNVGLKPTLTDLVEVYLSKNLKRKVRNPEGEAKFERSTRSIFEALASDLPNGMDTEIDSLERQTIKRIARLYGVEKEARGALPEQRVALRQAKATPILDDLESVRRQIKWDIRAV